MSQGHGAPCLMQKSFNIQKGPIDKLYLWRGGCENSGCFKLRLLQVVKPLHQPEECCSVLQQHKTARSIPINSVNLHSGPLLHSSYP